jgi:hypothetical protein
LFLEAKLQHVVDVVVFDVEGDAPGVDELLRVVQEAVTALTLDLGKDFGEGLIPDLQRNALAVGVGADLHAGEQQQEQTDCFNTAQVPVHGGGPIRMGNNRRMTGAA